MRVLALVLAFASLAPLARAEEAKAPVKKKLAPIIFDDFHVRGDGPPSALIIPRDRRVTQDLDSSTGQRLNDAADRK